MGTKNYYCCATWAGVHFAMEEKLRGRQLNQHYSHFLLSENYEELREVSAISNTYKLRAKLDAKSTSIKHTALVHHF